MNEYSLYRYIRIGVLVSISLFLIGIILIISNQNYILNQSIEPNDLLNQLLKGDPLAIIYLGIINLILIPIISLLYLEITYVTENDKNASLLTIITILMLTIVIIIRIMLF